MKRREALKAIALLGLQPHSLIGQEPKEKQIRVEQTKAVLHPESGVDLETRTYYLDNNAPIIVFAPGLGGTAEQNCSAYSLTTELVKRGYRVKLFSPRNSGNSTGHLTIGNYVSDTELVLKDTAQSQGQLPYVVGHSMGGYALGKILEEEMAKKAVLLAPLLDVTEQNPEIINRLLKSETGKSLISEVLGTILGAQRFSTDEDAKEFLESLYIAEPCNSQLAVPTHIFLPNRTNFGLRINNLEELKIRWERLQTPESKTKIYPTLNHYFSTGIFPLGNEFFRRSPETKQILEDITEFFS